MSTEIVPLPHEREELLQRTAIARLLAKHGSYPSDERITTERQFMAREAAFGRNLGPVWSRYTGELWLKARACDVPAPIEPA